VTDEQMLPSLLESIEQPIERCMADGAYDRKRCYQTCHERGIQLITPPACNAVLQSPDQADVARQSRDQAIERIQELTKEYAGDREAARKKWKEEVEYHQRSLVETAMYRFKTLCGGKLFSRKESSQQREALIKVNVINKMTQLGMPLTTVVLT
jgi:hypothetical protein